jgi:polysaccharide biosynthesis transport protein
MTSASESQPPPLNGNLGSARSFASVNHSPPMQDDDDTVQISPSHLWGAFRRRWLLATLLGMIAAGPVAYLAWKYVPAPYVSEAEIQVLVSPPRTLYEAKETQGSFRNFKAEQLKEVKHERILTQVLFDEEIMRLPMIREAKKKNPDLIPWLQDKLLVKSSSDEFFTISLEGEDPESLQKIVQSVTDVYLNSSVGGLQKSNDARIAELEKKLRDRELKIDDTKQKIEDAGVQSAPGQRDLERESKLAELNDINSDIRAAQRELNTLEAQLKVLNTSGVKFETTEAPTMSDSELDVQIKMDERYRAVERRVKILERHLKDYRESVNSETHPKIVELKQSVEQAKQDLESKYAELKEWYREEEQKIRQVGEDQTVASLGIQIENLKSYIMFLTEERDKKKIADEEALNLQKNTLVWEEELKHNKDVAHTIRTELEKLTFESNSTERIHIYRDANLPRQRNMKKKYLLAGGGGFGAFGLMIALVTLLELRFMRISSLKHLEHEFQFPILGTLPNLPARFMNGNDTSGKGEFYRHVFAESVDTTRTMIINLQKQQKFNTLMVTSALGGEGKSTLSCHLAISFARAGRKTLLIDADLRSPRVHEVFQMNDFPGMCEAIRNEIPVEKCIAPTPIPRLSLLPAGELDGATLRLLAEDRVGELLKRLRQDYDMIIFDSAPVLPVTDTLLLLQSVDGIVLSVRKDVTRISKLSAALSKIEMLGGKLFGAVVIGIGEDDYGYRSKYIRNYQSSLKRDSEEFEAAGAN